MSREKAIELLKEARKLKFYPHDDRHCNCKSCQAVDLIDQALTELAKQPEVGTSDAVKILEKRYNKTVAQIAIEQEDNIEQQAEQIQRQAKQLKKRKSFYEKHCEESEVQIDQLEGALKEAIHPSDIDAAQFRINMLVGENKQLRANKKRLEEALLEH